jgi:hypothetical protein
MTNNYPLIFIPETFKDYKDHSPTINEFAELYGMKLPEQDKFIYEPKEPSKTKLVNKDEVYLKENTGCLPILLLFGLPILFFYYTFSHGWNPKFFLGIGLIEVIFIPINFGIKNNLVSENLSNEEYEKLLDEYQIEYLKYKYKLTTYEKNKLLYNSEMKAICALYENNIVEAKQKIYHKKIHPYCEPILRTENKTRGKYDRHFADILKRCYPNSIVSLDLEPSGSIGWYQPDIVFTDKETNLSIDIEIDEPYVLNSGKPIHCIGDDDDRNNYFLRENWVVLRFTERQIINHPDECCRLVFSIVQHVKFGIAVENKVPIESRWTFEAAGLMAKDNYRQKYFPDPKYIFFK